MHLEYQDLLQAHPGLAEHLNGFPNGIFSGKEHIKPNSRAVFFCFARPAFDRLQSEQTGEDIWSVDAGDVKWYLYDLDSSQILEDPASIIQFIRSEPETPRKTTVPTTELSEIHGKIQKHINKTYLRKVQAPIGVKPTLRAWMELN